MMKQFVTVLLLNLLLTACGQVPAGTVTSVPMTQNTIPTPSPIPTNTITTTSTQTPIPSITPLPTIPTFTPTFDASTIVTVTPAPKTECPKETLALRFNPRNLEGSGGNLHKQFVDYTLEFLNSGGSIQSIRMSYEYPAEYIRKEDLTGDGIGEVIFASGIWIDILAA